MGTCRRTVASLDRKALRPSVAPLIEVARAGVLASTLALGAFWDACFNGARPSTICVVARAVAVVLLVGAVNRAAHGAIAAVVHQWVAIVIVPVRVMALLPVGSTRAHLVCFDAGLAVDARTAIAPVVGDVAALLIFWAGDGACNAGWVTYLGIVAPLISPAAHLGILAAPACLGDVLAALFDRGIPVLQSVFRG